MARKKCKDDEGMKEERPLGAPMGNMPMGMVPERQPKGRRSKRATGSRKTRR